MPIQAEIDAMIPRACAGKIVRRQDAITVYSAGLKAKIRQAEYALLQLSTYATKADQVTTAAVDIPPLERLHFYVDSFFAFLYSSLDVLAQVVNQTQNLGLEEHRVSFNKVKATLDATAAGTALHAHFTRISKAHRFTNLERYRNCSTHRRQIFIQTIATTHTPGYATGPVDSVRRILCDNPLTLTPQMNQNRELIAYCKGILEWLQGQVELVVRDI